MLNIGCRASSRYVRLRVHESCHSPPHPLSILARETCTKVAYQGDGLCRRTPLYALVLPAIDRPRDELVSEEIAAEQRVIAEQVVSTQDLVDLRFAEYAPGGNPRPEHPKAKHLVARLRRPAHHPRLRIEMTGDALNAQVIDRIGCHRLAFQPATRRKLGAEVLEVLIADRAREHV